MDKIFEDIKKHRIIPVVKIENSDNALALGDALIKGGLAAAEITFRTDAAEESIKLLAEKYPDMLLGAGTVLNIENVDRAVNAGAKFIVAPGFNPAVVDYCISKNIPVVPGINNPSQVEWGMEKGLEVLKFFPAEISGGLKMLKAMGAVYNVSFIPTGGINLQNMGDYLSYEKVLALGGTWMVKSELISGRNFDRITELTKEAVKAASILLI